MVLAASGLNPRSGAATRSPLTARKLADVADLRELFGDAVLPLALGATDYEQVRQAVSQAHAPFGRLDIVLNNAGYTLVGTVEEASEADVHALFETNFFGTLLVIQAAPPLLRQQGSGHIIGFSSGMGMVAIPLIGFYCSSKWAIEALHDSLAQEVRGLGIKVTPLEPAAYATDFANPSSLKMAEAMEAYADLRKQISGRLSNEERGDPNASAEAILRIVDAEDPALRFAVGTGMLPRARAAYAERLAAWEAWEAVSNAAQGKAKNRNGAI